MLINHLALHFKHVFCQWVSTSAGMGQTWDNMSSSKNWWFPWYVQVLCKFNLLSPPSPLTPFPPSSPPFNCLLHSVLENTDLWNFIQGETLPIFFYLEKMLFKKEKIRNTLSCNLELHKLIGCSEAELFGITCCFGSCFQVQRGANQSLSCFWEFPVPAMELQ